MENVKYEEPKRFVVVCGMRMDKPRRMILVGKESAEDFARELRKKPFVTYAYVEECNA